MLYRPLNLKKGARVALIAPSSPVDSKDLDIYVNELKKLDFDIIIKESCFQNSHPYLSGSDNLRAKDIMDSFLDKSIDGIFCIRGGYGAGRILDKIDFGEISKNPKPFFGYSDITALHIAINQNCRFITYHTPMPNKFANLDNYSYNSMNNLIFDKNIKKIQNPEGQPFKFIRKGNLKGILTGGNLSVICSLLSTKYEINTKGKVLFIEEVDEPDYKIDRMLNQLRLSKKFLDCSGVIFGNFEGCSGISIKKILKMFDFGVPIMYNLKVGHGIPSTSLPMGAMISINNDCEIDLLW